jgi:hypothetical protein
MASTQAKRRATSGSPSPAAGGWAALAFLPPARQAGGMNKSFTKLVSLLIPRRGRQATRCITVALTALYPILVALLAVLKGATEFFDAVPWAAVVYGPAITIVCTCFLIHVAIVLECWLRE